MTPCEKHAERDGRLAVHLPSLGIKRYMCEECRAELDAVFARLAKLPRQHEPYGRDYHGWEMSPFGVHYISESAYFNPNSIYSRMEKI